MQSEIKPIIEVKGVSKFFGEKQSFFCNRLIDKT